MKKFISLQKVLMFLGVFMMGSISAEAQKMKIPKPGSTGTTQTIPGSQDNCYQILSTTFKLSIGNHSNWFYPTDPNYYQNLRITSIVVNGYSTIGNPVNILNRDINIGEVETFYLDFSDPDIAAILANEISGSYINLSVTITYKQKSAATASRIWSKPISVTDNASWAFCGNGGQQLFSGNPKLATDTEETELEVSPNPAKDNLNIDFNLGESSEVSLGIFNSVGKEVKSVLVNQTLEEGKHNENVSLEGLSSGVYYLIMTKGDEVFTEKLVKI